MTERTIEYMPLSELEPALRNPHRNNLPAISRSISRFGYVEPIVIDERTLRLVGGHGRVEDLLARSEAGEPPPDGITGLDDGWLAPVVRGWRSIDDAEAEAYIVAANRTTELGGWADSLLIDVLGDLDDDQLAATGFSSDDLDDLLADAADSVHAADEYGDVLEDGKTVKEREDTYRDSAMRAILVPVPTAQYEAVVRMMSELRERWGIETNAEVVIPLLEEATA